MKVLLIAGLFSLTAVVSSATETTDYTRKDPPRGQAPVQKGSTGFSSRAGDLSPVYEFSGGKTLSIDTKFVPDNSFCFPVFFQVNFAEGANFQIWSQEIANSGKKI